MVTRFAKRVSLERNNFATSVFAKQKITFSSNLEDRPNRRSGKTISSDTFIIRSLFRQLLELDGGVVQTEVALLDGRDQRLQVVVRIQEAGATWKRNLLWDWQTSMHSDQIRWLFSRSMHLACMQRTAQMTCKCSLQKSWSYSLQPSSCTVPKYSVACLVGARTATIVLWCFSYISCYSHVPVHAQCFFIIQYSGRSVTAASML